MIAHYYNKYDILHDKYKLSAMFADHIVRDLGIDHTPGRCAIHVTQFYFIITYMHSEHTCFAIEGLHDKNGRDSDLLTCPIFIFADKFPKNLNNLEIKVSVETDADIWVKPEIILMSDPECIEKLKSYIDNTSLNIMDQK